jgi:myosin heavy subunit
MLGRRWLMAPLAQALYGKLFDWLVARINRTLHNASERKLVIGILDIFGARSAA